MSHMRHTELSCCWCGASAPSESPADWTFRLQSGRVTRGCPACTRSHLQEIETLVL